MGYYSDRRADQWDQCDWDSKPETIPVVEDDEFGGWRVRGKYWNDNQLAHWFPRQLVAPNRPGEELELVSACDRMRLEDSDGRLYHQPRCGQCDIARAKARLKNA